jgi:predicted phosphodiesterase
MLAHIDADSLNCIAYVTIQHSRPPITIAPTLGHFLNSIVQQDSADGPIQGSDDEVLSRQDVAQSAEWASRQAKKYLSDSEVVFSRSQTQEVLEPLSQLFRRAHSSAFAAIIGGDSETKDTMGLALSRSGFPCFWIERGKEALEVIDPLLPVQMLADIAIPYPQCVFWSKQGAACNVPIDWGKQICNDLIQSRNEPDQIHQIIQQSRRRRMRATTILHLSDLHYGRPEPVEQEQYLLAHLEDVAPIVDRVVITGDLCQTPSRENIASFNNFRRQIERMGKQVAVIPGNHDARTGGTSMGKLGRALGVLAQLEWSRLIIDHELRIVFFCFDSSQGGIAARGRVEDRELLSMATNYQIKRQYAPDIANYFKIALIHHHPFPFEGKRNLLQSLWSKLTLDDDIYLRLERSEEFVDWCQKMGVQIVLHGHKHIPKWFIRDGMNRISAVGCGSTAGIDGDLSYVMVAVDSVSKRFSASFYRGAKDGTGFEPMFMTATLI